MKAKPAKTVEVKPKAAKEILPKGIIKVVAVIRPMHSPVDNIRIPEGAIGVLIKESSWAKAQLERGLIKIVG